MPKRTEGKRLSVSHRLVLSKIVRTGLYLREINEGTRQRVIDLGMLEPPLVEVDGDLVTATEAGRSTHAAYEGISS